jgi:HEAT repeat protein
MATALGRGVVLLLAGLLPTGLEAREASRLPAEQVLSQVRGGQIAEAIETYQAAFDVATPEGLRQLRRIAVEILRVDLHRGDPYEQALVAGVLGREGDSAAVAHLERALRSADPLEQRTAADSLAQLGTPRAMETLRRAYEEDPDNQRLVLFALANTDERAAVPLYVHALGSRDSGLRITGLKRLGELRVLEARAEVRQMLARESHPVVQTYLDFSLAAMGDEASLARLRKRMEDRRVSVRDSAAGLLGVLADPSAAPLLRNALQDRAFLVRATAGASLTRFKDASGLGAVERSLDDPDLGVRIAAASSLARMDYPTGRPLILKALRSVHPGVRAQALRVIGDNQDRPALQVVGQTVLNEPEATVLAQAILTLGRIGDAATVAMLMRLLPESRDVVRHAAAESLIHLTDRLLQQEGAGCASQSLSAQRLDPTFVPS